MTPSVILSTAAYLLAVVAVSADDAIIPPATQGYPISEQYQVLVNGRACPVYDTRVFFQLNNPDRLVSFTQFDFRDTVTVEVIVPRQVRSVRIRPTSAGVDFTRQDNRIRFTLRRPAKLSIEINGGIDDNLHLFANAPEAVVPQPDDPNVLYYGPGIHSIDGGYGILRLKSHQTLYLAAGAVLRARLLAEDAEGIRICGRGILEGTTLLGRHPEYYRKFVGEPDNVRRSNFVQFNRCRDIQVEGIVLNDSPAWSLVFDHCDGVQVENIKEFGYVDNTDGIDIVSSRNVVIRDIFSRINDDCIAIKSHGDDVENVSIADSVLWSDRAVGLQIGHETISANISQVTCRNIDILEQRNRYMGHYAMGVFNGDHATVSDVLFDDIRVENCERLISLIIEKGFFNQSDRRGRIENIHFRNIRSATTCDIHLYGFDADSAVRNITFENLFLRDRPAAPKLFANFHVHNLTFQQAGQPTKQIASTLEPDTRLVPLDLAEYYNRSLVDNQIGDGQGWFDLGPELDLSDLPTGIHTLGGVPFHLSEAGPKGAIVLRGARRLVEQPHASYPVKIGQRVRYLYFLHGTAFTDETVEKTPPTVWIGQAGKLLFNQSPIGTPLWHYVVRYADDGTEVAVPVQAGLNVEDWEIWAPGGWVVPLCGKKFYVQQWTNPYPHKPLDSVKVVSALRPEVPALLGITLGLDGKQ